LRIKNLVKIAAWTEGELTACARMILAEGENRARGDRRWRETHSRILRVRSQVETLCRREGVSPLTLPPPSLRAYQWFRFLSEDDGLSLHITTLSKLIAADNRPQVRLYHIGGWWKVWSRAADIRLTVSELFVGAPQPVLTALVKLALPYSKKRVHRRVIEEYAETPAFKAMQARLEGDGGSAVFVAKGRHHDLDEAFVRVNAQYFGGRLERPRLRWSRSVNRREFGNYQPSADTVTLSRALDAPDVPSYVIDFIMFHELLHKHLGTTKVNGRRRAHTPGFRAAERRFSRFADATDHLTQLSKGLRARRQRR
jgi:hypothetical protein